MQFKLFLNFIKNRQKKKQYYFNKMFFILLKCFSVTLKINKLIINVENVYNINIDKHK